MLLSKSKPERFNLFIEEKPCFPEGVGSNHTDFTFKYPFSAGKPVGFSKLPGSSQENVGM